MSAVTFPKDPNDVLPWSFDWSSWLSGGETVASFVINASTGLTVVSQSNTTTQTTAVLSGGVSGTPYEVQHVMTTSAGNVKALTMTIRVQNN